MTDPVAVALTALASGAVSFRTATVSSVAGSAVTLSRGGSLVSPTARLSSYTPAVGDVVLLLVSGSGMVVLGRLVSAR